MFEAHSNFDTATPFVPAREGGANGQAGGEISSGGTALRAFGWSELAARINAARDLRHVLQLDRDHGSASFADAAAGYFNPLSNGKRHVNHGDLEHRKSCWGNAAAVQEAAASGDEEI